MIGDWWSESLLRLSMDDFDHHSGLLQMISGDILSLPGKRLGEIISGSAPHFDSVLTMERRHSGQRSRFAPLSSPSGHEFSNFGNDLGSSMLPRVHEQFGDREDTLSQTLEATAVAELAHDIEQSGPAGKEEES